MSELSGTDATKSPSAYQSARVITVVSVMYRGDQKYTLKICNRSTIVHVVAMMRKGMINKCVKYLRNAGLLVKVWVVGVIDYHRSS